MRSFTPVVFFKLRQQRLGHGERAVGQHAQIGRLRSRRGRPPAGPRPAWSSETKKSRVAWCALFQCASPRSHQKPAPAQDGTGFSRFLRWHNPDQVHGVFLSPVTDTPGGSGDCRRLGQKAHVDGIVGPARSVAKMPQVRQYGVHIAAPHTKPARQCGGVLVHRGAGQQTPLAHVPLVLRSSRNCPRSRVAARRKTSDPSPHHRPRGGDRPSRGRSRRRWKSAYDQSRTR